jgi:hypothetical protein
MEFFIMAAAIRQSLRQRRQEHFLRPDFLAAGCQGEAALDQFAFGGVKPLIAVLTLDGLFLGQFRQDDFRRKAFPAADLKHQPRDLGGLVFIGPETQFIRDNLNISQHGNTVFYRTKKPATACIVCPAN